MSDTTVTYTFPLREKFTSILSAKGVAVDEKASWLKCLGPGPYRVYVPKSKTVRRIDVAFEVPLSDGLTKFPDQGQFGSIKQQMRFDGSEEEVLARFELLVDHMLALVPPPKAAPAPRKASSPPAVASPPEGKKARKQLILDAAARLGMPVSEETLLEIEGAHVPELEATMPEANASEE